MQIVQKIAKSLAELKKNSFYIVAGAICASIGTMYWFVNNAEEIRSNIRKLAPEYFSSIDESLIDEKHFDILCNIVKADRAGEGCEELSGPINWWYHDNMLNIDLIQHTYYNKKRDQNGSLYSLYVYGLRNDKQIFRAFIQDCLEYCWADTKTVNGVTYLLIVDPDGGTNAVAKYTAYKLSSLSRLERLPFVYVREKNDKVKKREIVTIDGSPYFVTLRKMVLHEPSSFETETGDWILKISGEADDDYGQLEPYAVKPQPDGIYLVSIDNAHDRYTSRSLTKIVIGNDITVNGRIMKADIKGIVRIKSDTKFLSFTGGNMFYLTNIKGISGDGNPIYEFADGEYEISSRYPEFNMLITVHDNYIEPEDD